MWVVAGLNIEMTKGDYGVQLPIAVSGVTIGGSDQIRFTLKKPYDHETVLEKTFSSISQNTVNLELTKLESEALKTGAYIYTLDWYRNNVFMCNLIPSASFKVVAKA